MKTFRYRKPLIVLGVAIIAAALALGARAESDVDAGAADTTIEAVWKPQRVNFVYRGYHALYTCASLQQKLRRILRTVGANGELTLRTYFCDDLSGTARFQIAMQSPVEATPENIRALTMHDSQDVLVARVRGEDLPTAEDVERFPAVWKTISLGRDRKLRLAPADCELVRALRRQILPRMSVQVVRDNVRCSVYGNVAAPRLVVSALVPANTALRD
jgi:hypothetical protein